jgi:hypothetical protein
VSRLEPGSILAGFRIEGVLARGGMGVVYRAIDPELDRIVALKVIAPEYAKDDTAVARFTAEARAAAALEHPNIVPIHRAGQFEGVLYLAMRLVQGTTLREVIDHGPMDPERVARITSDVASALDAAHARDLVHRDVKPANILLGSDGRREHVYLSDFGVAKRLAAPTALTRAGAVVGTPDYIAPEQVYGEALDGRADVYALGCVAYEMLTGRVPFPRDTDMAKLWAHVNDPPPRPSIERPELLAAFDIAVARATAKDPAARYQTAGELAAALNDVAAEQQRVRPAGAAGALSPADQVTRDELPSGEPAPTGGAATAPSGMAPPPAATGPPPAAAGAPPPAAGPAVRRGTSDDTGAPPPGAPPSSGGDGGRFGRRGRTIAAVIGVVAVAAIAAIVLLSSGSDGGGAKGEEISGDLAPVPLNGVKGSGRAVVQLDGNVADVKINAAGLLDAAPHAMHFHAGGKGDCPPASAGKLHNGHRAIATLDGAPFYGPAVTALTLRGDTNPKKSLLAFPRFPSTGKFDYERKLDVGPAVASSLRANDVSVVVHGIDYNGNGVYDGSLDRSDLNRSLPGEATAPGLCGHLVAAKTSASAGVIVLTAALTVEDEPRTALYCTLPRSGAAAAGA